MKRYSSYHYPLYMLGQRVRARQWYAFVFRSTCQWYAAARANALISTVCEGVNETENCRLEFLMILGINVYIYNIILYYIVLYYVILYYIIYSILLYYIIF